MQTLGFGHSPVGARTGETGRLLHWPASWTPWGAAHSKAAEQCRRSLTFRRHPSGMDVEYIGTVREDISRILGDVGELEELIRWKCRHQPVSRVTIAPLIPGRSGAVVFLVRRLDSRGARKPWLVVSNQQVSPTSGDQQLQTPQARLMVSFPINRCHQRVVTKDTALAIAKSIGLIEFPINRCHQRVVTSAGAGSDGLAGPSPHAWGKRDPVAGASAE